MSAKKDDSWSRSAEGCYVALTNNTISITDIMNRVRSNQAGAIVLFAGTTRDNFQGKAVKELQYSAYALRALKTMLEIAQDVRQRYGPAWNEKSAPAHDASANGHQHAEHTHTDDAASCCPRPLIDPGVQGIAIVHRLGTVPVGEESILIAVSSAHRQAGWRAGEELLELVKKRVEVWKLEEFEDGEGVWRANRDGAEGVRVDR